MRRQKFKTIATQADTISVNFYVKNGFVEFPKKSKKIEFQPAYSPDVVNQGEKLSTKYKTFEPWLDYIEDYYASVLMVYRIFDGVDFANIRATAKKQREKLIAQISQLKYRKHFFHVD